VIEEAAKLARVEDRLFFLRSWALRNRRRQDAHIVVEHALTIAIRATEYTPNARDFRQLAMPLPFIADDEKRRGLVLTFDAQRGAVETRGPTVDFVRLQLLLAEAEGRTNYKGMANRLVETYLHVLQQVSDLSVRSECLGHFLSALTRVAGAEQLEKDESLRSLAMEEIERCVDSLLKGTAEQLEVLRGTIESLGVAKSALGEQIANRLNIEPRRDRARLALVVAAISTRRVEVPLPELSGIVYRIEDPSVRSEAIHAIWSSLNTSETGMSFRKLLPFVRPIEQIRDPFFRCQAFVAAIKTCVADKSEDWSSMSAELEQNLINTWEAIDPAWERISAAFTIAAECAGTASDISRAFMERAANEKEAAAQRGQGCSEDYISSVAVAVSAFSGLLQRHIDCDNDLEKLRELIKHVPSHEFAVLIWADIAERLFLHGRHEKCKEVVEQQVRPLLDRFSGPQRGTREDLTVSAAAALYCGSGWQRNQQTCGADLIVWRNWLTSSRIRTRWTGICSCSARAVVTG
jgi:hypothetical protein